MTGSMPRSVSSAALNEFEKTTLEVTRRCLGDDPPHSRGAREIHAAYGRMGDLGFERIDAGISRVDLVADGICRILLRQEAMVVALPDDHPLASREEAITLESIKDEPFLVQGNTSSEMQTLYDVLVRFLAERGHPIPAALGAD